MEEANLMKKINDYEKQIISDDKKEKHILYGKKIVFTGFRDKTTMETITKLGGELANSVSKNTFIVIVKDNESKDEDTGKIEQAKKLNIPILALEEFKNKYL
jgi:NAD-dependent DNA ligase